MEERTEKIIKIAIRTLVIGGFALAVGTGIASLNRAYKSYETHNSFKEGAIPQDIELYSHLKLLRD